MSLPSARKQQIKRNTFAFRKSMALLGNHNIKALLSESFTVRRGGRTYLLIIRSGRQDPSDALGGDVRLQSDLMNSLADRSHRLILVSRCHTTNSDVTYIG